MSRYIAGSEKVTYVYEKDIVKYQIVFEYVYNMFIEGLKFTGYEKLKKGMTIKQFINAWWDMADTIDYLYKQLIRYNNDFYYMKGR